MFPHDTYPHYHGYSHPVKFALVSTIHCTFDFCKGVKMGIHCAWRQKIAILIRMQFFNDIIKSRKKIASG